MASDWLFTATLLVLSVVAGAVAVSTACGVNMVFTLRISRDRAPWYRVVVPYLAGSVLGAAVVGSVLAGVGLVVRELVGASPTAAWPGWASLPLAVGAALLGFREVGLLRIRLPQRASQLNSDGPVLGVSRRLFWFGAWLGAAFFTYSPYGGLYLLALAVVLAPSIGTGVLLFVVFGLSRGMTVIGLSMLASTWDEAAALSDHVAAWYRPAQLLTAASLAGVVVAGAVMLL
jgi:hypothetical protein